MVNFLKFSRLYAIISLVVILTGIYFIARHGYIYSIDFVGGTNLEYQLDRSVSEAQLKTVLEKNKIEVVTLQQNDQVATLRTKPIDEKQEAALRAGMKQDLKVNTKVLRFETVGPVIGQETVQKTVIASIIAMVGILLYMTYAFKSFEFALAAIVAMLHDFLVVIGMYAVLSYFFKAELDSLFVTALLTSMSFSVHDTIVIFDKIREYMKLEGRENIDIHANKALTETLVRSLNNSMTIIFMLVALVLLGGTSIRFFAAALLIGTVTGSYSSPFVATPLLVWLIQRKK